MTTPNKSKTFRDIVKEGGEVLLTSEQAAEIVKYIDHLEDTVRDLKERRMEDAFGRWGT